uniref:Uncharacterized protein n=1 Tax=Arundo donax TaxID=35708 RepID=A0A0A9BP44_ARUDO
MLNVLFLEQMEVLRRGRNLNPKEVTKRT